MISCKQGYCRQIWMSIQNTVKLSLYTSLTQYRRTQ